MTGAVVTQLGNFSPLADIDAAADELVRAHSGLFQQDGLTIMASLGTIMICWHGIEAVLSDRQGGVGFDMGAFARLLLQLALALTLLHCYTHSMWGFPSVQDVVIDSSSHFVRHIESGGERDLYAAIGVVDKQFSEDVNVIEGMGVALRKFAVRLELFVLRAIMYMVTGFTVVALAVLLMVGPLFIPWLVVPKLDWLFWGWVKALLATAFMKVVAAGFVVVYAKATVIMLKKVMEHPSSTGAGIAPVTDSVWFTILGVYCCTVVWGMTKVPAVTMAIFSGTGVGGSGFAEVVQGAAMSVSTGIVMRGGGAASGAAKGAAVGGAPGAAAGAAKGAA